MDAELSDQAAAKSARPEQKTQGFGLVTKSHPSPSRLARDATPFLIEVRQIPTSLGAGGRQESSGGELAGASTSTSKFRPEATVIATAELRASGFLQAAPQDVLQSILLLLTFVTPNGFVSPSLSEIAATLRVSHAAARCRMRRAYDWRWNGSPSVLPIHRQSGLNAYSPSPKIAKVRHLPVQGDLGDVSAHHGSRPAGREAVIAWSRARYARPLEEVERIVEQQLHGSLSFLPPVPASVSDAGGVAAEEAYRALVLIGVATEEAERLVLTYGEGRVQQQISWLPHRHARRPDRYLVAAIEQGYGEPPQARIQASALLPEQSAASTRGKLGDDDGDDDEPRCVDFDEDNAPLEREIAAMEEDEDGVAHESVSGASPGATAQASGLPAANLDLPGDERP